MFTVEEDGSNWKVIVNPGVLVENIVDWNSSQFGKSGYKAALGYDSRPPAGTKLVYLLFPKTDYTREELTSDTYQLQLSKMARKCNVCATIDALRNEQTEPVPNVAERQVATVPTSRQISAGDVVGPTWVPKVANVGKKLFCTSLGNVATSVIGSVLFDLMSGWSTDPGQKDAMRQISDQLIDLEINPDDVPMIRQDALKMYQAWQDGGPGEALRVGLFKQFDDAIKEGIGVDYDTKKVITTTRRASVRKGIAGSLVVE